MAETISQHQQSAFTVPVNGTTANAPEVLNNDNTLRGKHNDHDADAGVHLQSSTLAARPAFGVAGRKWLTTDERKIYYDTGAAWVEIAYISASGAAVFTDVQTFTETNSADPVILARLVADAEYRLQIEAGGALSWSDGASGVSQAALSRTGADTMSLGGAQLQLPNGSIATAEDGVGANSGAALDINYRAVNTYVVTLNANTAFTFSNTALGQVFYLILIGDGTPRTPTWPAGTLWAGGAAPTFTSTVGRSDVVMFLRATVPGPAVRYFAARIMTACV